MKFYDREKEFSEKVNQLMAQTPELQKLKIHIGSLALEDM